MIKQRSAVAGIGIGAALLVSVLQHEGYRDEAYIPVPGDVPTIGAGRTEGVRMGDKTNPVREMVYLLNNLEGVYAQGVRRCITAPMYDYEFAASVSFAYNVGVNAFCNSTMAKKFNAEDYPGACAELSRWVYGPGKKKLPGLVKRRDEERAICEGRA